jgi:acyl carrier protein
MTFEELYAAVAPVGEQVLQVPKFDSTVTMTSTPAWDSLKHVQLLSAIEKRFGIEISPDEAFKLTSADRLVRYLHNALGRGAQA